MQRLRRYTASQVADLLRANEDSDSSQNGNDSGSDYEPGSDDDDVDTDDNGDDDNEAADVQEIQNTGYASPMDLDFDLTLNSTADEPVEQSSQDQPQGIRADPQRQTDNGLPYVWVDAEGIVPRDIPFTGNGRVTVDTHNWKPLDYWKMYVDDDLLRHITHHTNLYAEQVIRGEGDIGPHSRLNSWTPTSSEELYKFFGLVLLMGIVRKPAIAHYWSKDPLYSTPIFGTVMSRNRFQILLSMLHYNDNTQAPVGPNRDRMYKLRPILDHLFERFQAVYELSRDIAVDESLLLWKGRLLFKQYIPLKRARYGIKMFKLCESTTGYTYRFRVYPGKDSQLEFPPEVTQPPVTFSSTEKIVWHLMLPLLNKGHHLYVDNFYTSLPLFKELFEYNTPACGTIRKTRKGFPTELVKKKQRMGQSSSLRCDPLLAVKFSDKKDVHMLSTIHNSATRTVTRRRNAEAIQKPVCVLDYTANMGGVDLSDQMIEPYDATRKTMSWYKKLVIHLFQIAVLNAHIIYCQTTNDNPKLSFLTFTREISNSLLSGNNALQNEATETYKRLTERHFPALIPPTPGKQNAQKRCRVCTKSGVRKDVRSYCPTCPSLPGLCAETCFKIYHTELNY